MEKNKEYLLWFEQLERKDVDIVGGKSSSLGEMTSNTDVPVPYGFATTSFAYHYFVDNSDLRQELNALLSELTDVENSTLLHDVCSRIRKLNAERS
jgi:pyruvate,water dikinase